MGSIIIQCKIYINIYSDLDLAKYITQVIIRVLLDLKLLHTLCWEMGQTYSGLEDHFKL